LLDKRNECPGGWSEVRLLELPDAAGGGHKFALKRQLNFRSRTLRHPLVGLSTAQIEFGALRAFAAVGIRAPQPVFFAHSSDGGGDRAILATRWLDGFRSLREIEREWERGHPPDRMRKLRIIDAAASVVRRMHEEGWCHYHLYGKHIMVLEFGDRCEGAVIDLESARRPMLFGRGRARDFGSLHRRAPMWSAPDRMRFLLRALGVKRLGDSERKIVREILRDSKRKRRSSGASGNAGPA